MNKEEIIKELKKRIYIQKSALKDYEDFMKDYNISFKCAKTHLNRYEKEILFLNCLLDFIKLENR